MHAEPSLLSVRDLRVAYLDKAAVDGVSFDIAPAEIVGLTGESGCGKSSLTLALLGLARSGGEITGGEVRFDGRNLLKLDDDSLRSIRGAKISLIVQNPQAALNPMLTVGRQVARVWSTHRANRESVSPAQRALEMLNLVGINDAERRATAYAHELSGGMAQRVLIAAAMAAEPKLLVADEPTSGLDVTVQAQFLDWMWRTVRTRGTAMLLVTQEPGILANYCDRVVVMARGRLISDKPAAAHFARHTPARLTVPEPRADSERIAKVAGLEKHFPLRGSTKVVHAVNDVSFDIRHGETLGLVGESGSGKTTVGRCVVALETPSSGVVEACGENIAALEPETLRRLRAQVQIVRQDPFDSFDPRWTMERSLAEPLAAHGLASAADRKSAVRALFEQVGVDPIFLNARPAALSAGALQRLAIARALSTQPKLLVLDEPTSVLPPAARREIVALLQRIQARTDVSYLFISHDLTTIASVCHRVAVMYLGQIVEIGATAEIFRTPRHPYTRALIAAHLDEDVDNRRPDRAKDDQLQGEIPSPIDLPSGCFLASRCSYKTQRCEQERQNLAHDSANRLVRCWRSDAVAEEQRLRT
jgi:oligopeptide/dipeptide ABC transporter ATP-binding protein